MEYGCRGDNWSPVVVLKSDVKGAVPHETTTPTLRATSPQGEAYKAPIEGSCRQSRLRGEKKWALRSLSCTKPPLRPLGTSPQGEAYKAPIEGSCRQSRLRGGEKWALRSLSCTKPPLRPLGTSPQGEAFRLPSRGAVDKVD